MGLLCSNPADPCSCAACQKRPIVGSEVMQYDFNTPQHIWISRGPTDALLPPTSCPVKVTLISGDSTANKSGPGFYVNAGYLPAGGQTVSYTYNFIYDGNIIYTQKGSAFLIAPGGAWIPFSDPNWHGTDPTWNWDYTGAASSQTNPICTAEVWINPPIGLSYGGYQPEVASRGWNFYSA
jgi:hypothetical protein